MDDFSQPGRSNMFGFPEGPNNYIVPGNRPQSTSSPIITLNGSTNALVANWCIRWCIYCHSNSNYHHQSSILWIFYRLSSYTSPVVSKWSAIWRRFPKTYLQELQDREHCISLNSSRELGVVQAIMQLAPPDGTVFAYSDRRKGGISAGYWKVKFPFFRLTHRN